MSGVKDPLLLAETRRFCKVEFDKPPYVQLDTRDKKVRHIALHIGGLAAYVVSVDQYSNIFFGTKVVGDLGMYRSMLLYEFGQDKPAEVHIEPDQPAINYLAFALGGFKNYLEPREHGGTSDELEITEIVIPNLQAAIDVLSKKWRIDPIIAQLTQMHKPEKDLVFL